MNRPDVINALNGVKDNIAFHERDTNQRTRTNEYKNFKIGN